jgi:hypothetical protein
MAEAWLLARLPFPLALLRLFVLARGRVTCSLAHRGHLRRFVLAGLRLSGALAVVDYSRFRHRNPALR